MDPTPKMNNYNGELIEFDDGAGHKMQVAIIDGVPAIVFPEPQKYFSFNSEKHLDEFYKFIKELMKERQDGSKSRV